jgi:cytochrome c553
MGAFPKLSGQTKDYISNRLYAYKNKEQIGAMSSTMWSQAGMLTDDQITTLSKYIETL